MTRVSRTTAVRAALFVLVGVATASTASAGTITTWSGTGANPRWNTSGNWTTSPTTSGTFSLVYSGMPTNSTSTNNTGVVKIDSILFSNSGTTGQTTAFTIGSNATSSMTLLNGATITTTAVSGTTLQETISSDVTLSGTTTFNLGRNHSLQLTGSIGGGGTIVKQGVDDLSIAASATINGGLGGLTIDAGGFQLTGVDKLSAINSLNGVNAVKIGGSAAATVTLSLGNPVGYSGTSTANFQMGNDATVQLTNNNSNNLRFTAADFNVANAAVTTAKALTFTGGGAGKVETVTIDGVIRDNSANGIVNVSFNGGNDYVLNGISTYTGTTTVATAVLVNGTLASPTVRVNSAAYLGGSGQLSGAVTVLSGGTLAPGGTSSGSTLTDTIARLAVGGLSLSSGATTNLSVTGTTAGSLFDQVAFTGGSSSLTYGGLLSLTLSGSYADQTSFGLFSGFTSQSGSFSSIILSAVGTDFDGKTFTQDGATGDWYTGWTANNQELKFSQSTGTLTVVPEPSTIVFAGIGMAMFGWSTWTHRRARARMQVMEAAAAS